MVGKAWAQIESAWTRLSALGTDIASPLEARAVIGANHFFILAVVANVPWAIALAALGTEVQPAPWVTHMAMVLTFAAGLALNRARMPLLASVLALAAPMLQYLYLAHVYSRGAGFQVLLLAIPALVFAMIGPRSARVRVVVAGAGLVTLVLVYALPQFAQPVAGVPTRTVDRLAVANIVSAFVLMFIAAAFNNHYFMRERRRNDGLLMEARTAAQTDSLTDALNRRGIAPVLSHSARAGQYAVALVDLDRFKRINDALGHGAGDVVLANVARTIVRSVGSRGAVARWGGEEFLVVLPGLGLPDALAVMEEVRMDVEDEYATEAIPERVTVSVGVAHGRQFSGKDDMLRMADARLYEAKASGRNLVLGGSLGARDRT